MSRALQGWVMPWGHMADFAAVLPRVMPLSWKGSISWEGADLVPVLQPWPGAAPASPPLGEAGASAAKPCWGQAQGSWCNAAAIHAPLHHAMHWLPAPQAPGTQASPALLRLRKGWWPWSPQPHQQPVLPAPSWPHSQCCFPGSRAFVLTCPGAFVLPLESAGSGSACTSPCFLPYPV